MMASRIDVLDLSFSDLKPDSTPAAATRQVELIGLPFLWLVTFVAAARALGL
jgi:hypothetical protein